MYNVFHSPTTRVDALDHGCWFAHMKSSTVCPGNKKCHTCLANNYCATFSSKLEPVLLTL